MLDAFKKDVKPARQQADELQALIAHSKEERAALSTMLTQVQLNSAKLASAGKHLDEVQEKATTAHTRLDELTATLEKAASRAKDLDTIDARIHTMTDAVARAERDTARLTAPDGDLQKHKEALQQLASQAVGTRASLEALRKDQAAVEAARDQLRETVSEITESRKQSDALKADFEQLRGAAGQLAQDQSRVKALTEESREEASATAGIVKDVQQRLGSLAKLQELAKLADERLLSLNALAEHVAQKTKALDSQKHTVERAVVEANRLNEMIWNMEVQIKKLDEGSRQVATTEELIDRVEKLAQEVNGHLETGTRARDALSTDLAKLEKDRAAFLDFARAQGDRLAVERHAFHAFDERVTALQQAVAAAESSMDHLADREGVAATLAQRVDHLSNQIQVLDIRAGNLQARQTSLDALQESLARVDDLAKRTARQHETLLNGQDRLDALGQAVQGLHATLADAAQLRDRVAADRTALESFLDRTTSFSAGVPELDARIDGIVAKLSTVDAGVRKAEGLASIANSLDAQMTRIEARQPLVDHLETRLNGLSTLSGDIDRKLEDALRRRADVEALASHIDGVAIQVTDTQAKLERVSALEGRLLPLADELATLERLIEGAQAGLATVQQDEAVLAAQEKRLARMVTDIRAVEADASARLRQVHGLVEELDRSTAIKDELLQGLAAAQAAQHHVAAGGQAAEDQLRHLDALSTDLDRRIGQLAGAETRMAALEARGSELAQLAERLEAKTQSLASRDALVGALRREVAVVHDLHARSKADLEYVESHRNDIAALRDRVDEALASIGGTEARLASIESQTRLVDEVEVKANAIAHMIDDLQLTLDTVGEQKAAVDHAMENFARLTEKVQEAQTTLRALQAERELAERIERGVRQARKKANGEGKAKLA